jgi:hypothetical protein
MSGSFLLPVHNSPAAPAAGEIAIKKKSHPGRSGSWMDQVNQVEKVVLNAQICTVFFH